MDANDLTPQDKQQTRAAIKTLAISLLVVCVVAIFSGNIIAGILIFAIGAAMALGLSAVVLMFAKSD